MKIPCYVENFTRELKSMKVHNLRPKKIPDQKTFSGEFFQIFKVQIMLIFHKFFYRLEKDETLPSVTWPAQS